jgi:hypothetical protein
MNHLKENQLAIFLVCLIGTIGFGVAKLLVILETAQNAS